MTVPGASRRGTRRGIAKGVLGEVYPALYTHPIPTSLYLPPSLPSPPPLPCAPCCTATCASCCTTAFQLFSLEYSTFQLFFSRIFDFSAVFHLCSARFQLYFTSVLLDFSCFSSNPPLFSCFSSNPPLFSCFTSNSSPISAVLPLVLARFQLKNQVSLGKTRVNLEQNQGKSEGKARVKGGGERGVEGDREANVSTFCTHRCDCFATVSTCIQVKRL